MYCPETIKRMNAEASLKWPEQVNSALVTINEALKEVAQVNLQIQLAHDLAKKPELEEKLLLVEQFYRARRKELLNLEGPVSTLAGICEALEILHDRYEKEKQILEGRLLIIEHTTANRNRNSYEKHDVLSKSAEASRKYEQIGCTLQEIKGVLSEYSTESSQDPLKKQLDGRLKRPRGEAEVLDENPYLNP